MPVKDLTRDFTIIIAHRGPALGLWSAIESCEAQLVDSPFRYDYVLVTNGNGEEKDIELDTLLAHMKRSGKLLDLIKVGHPMSPPDARQMGSESADGRFIFFFDNHCVAAPGYFDSAIKTFETTGADTVHSVTRFFCGEAEHLEYKLKLDTNFWAESKMVPRVLATEPYRIAAAGHGGFAVRRETWERLGGYGPLTMFTGYSGEELYWDLKLAMHGGTNWLDPHMIHHHWSGKRNYERHFSDDYFKNLMICAYVIGGQHWVDSAYRFFEHSAKTGPTPMYRLYEEAIHHSRPHKEQLDKTRLRTLEQQLEQFTELGIPF
jgi:glycosyl transferase family 2